MDKTQYIKIKRHQYHLLLASDYETPTAPTWLGLPGCRVCPGRIHTSAFTSGDDSEETIGFGTPDSLVSPRASFSAGPKSNGETKSQAAHGLTLAAPRGWPSDRAAILGCEHDIRENTCSFPNRHRTQAFCTVAKIYRPFTFHMGCKRTTHRIGLEDV